ncbi:IS5 family transposase [Teichococcus vastitatis]|uniref:IS5 family transposase n=1 Tax=Teichococcus vastitatis TaxID=2307076 RepID=A0ABS9W8W3_9PROT|nr:IS5 family transposase [Pseudoroseomonas vastitatis]MCI0755653.1 IS5 family transposase [Pseudoroseomonas vastitatis]
MWTKEHRARQAVFERRRYPTDLTDEEWKIVQPLLPSASARGRRPGADLREVLNAIRYLARAGCGWRMLPVHFGPWQTIYWWFRRLMRRFLFVTLHNIALMLDPERVGREVSPTAGVLDSQTVKSPHAAGGGGYDTAKRLKGRKRHIVVDTDGRLLMVNLTAAGVQDAAGAGAGAEQIIRVIRKRWPWLKHLFADGVYDRDKLISVAAYRDFVIEVVRKLAGQQGFQVLSRRWVVERTFGWMTRWRRLVRDYEHRCDVSEAMIHVSMGALLVRRIANP